MSENKQPTVSNATPTPSKDISEKSLEYFANHPAIVVTIFYVLITIIGLIYSWSFYNRFDLNIFDYAELNDFLLAAFKNENTIILCIGFLIINMVDTYFFYYYKKEKKPKGIVSLFGMFIVTIVLYIPLAPFITSGVAADRIIKKEAFTLSVQYRTGDKNNPIYTEDLFLLGTTDKFALFLKSKDKEVKKLEDFYEEGKLRPVVIPISNLVRIDY